MDRYPEDDMYAQFAECWASGNYERAEQWAELAAARHEEREMTALEIGYDRESGDPYWFGEE